MCEARMSVPGTSRTSIAFMHKSVLSSLSYFRFIVGSCALSFSDAFPQTASNFCGGPLPCTSGDVVCSRSGKRNNDGTAFAERVILVDVESAVWTTILVVDSNSWVLLFSRLSDVWLRPRGGTLGGRRGAGRALGLGITLPSNQVTAFAHARVRCMACA